MVKVVFFDWFDTLARFEPPRQELWRQAFLNLNIELPLKAITRGLLAGDRHFFEENTKSPPVKQRSPEEQVEVYLRYPNEMLAAAGVKTSPDILLEVMKIATKRAKEITYVLFDDVLPTLESLKNKNLVMGLLTNAARDALSVQHQLGLGPYISFVVTSEEVGASKPSPPIFLAALERAGVKAAEACHVGDQYDLDVAGARGVGISPILIDRENIYPEVTDCPRIRRLTEVAAYL